MSALNGVLAAAHEVEVFCKSQGWRFCFIGGLAVQRWGMPRFTQDVDLTLLTGFGSEERFIDSMLLRFPGREPDARSFALMHRVLLARTQRGVDLDIALGGLPFEEGAVARATPWQINEHVALTTCDASDLVIHKTFAARDRDWADLEGILVREWGKLDLPRIRKELPILLELKEDAEAMQKLEKMISTIDARMAGRGG